MGSGLPSIQHSSVLLLFFFFFFFEITVLNVWSCLILCLRIQSEFVVVWASFFVVLFFEEGFGL